MRGVNKVILVGNLGRDPEVKHTSQGKAVAKFSLATSERFKKDGEWSDRTEWHNIVLWEKQAEIAMEYAKKGNRVYIEGRLQTSSWDDKTTGQKKYMTEVIADGFMLLDKKEQDIIQSHPEPEPELAAVIDDSEIPF